MKLFKLISSRPHQRKRWVLWARLSALGVFVLALVMVLTMEWTSRPDFCITCHYMQSFHDSWAASKHNTVSCIKCHFEPGVAGTVRGKFQGLFQVFSYATSFYKKSKPWAEVSDATCEQSGCHVNQDQNKLVHFKNILFSHANHLKDIKRVAKLRCTSCHSQMVQGEHLNVTSGTCFTCHFKSGTNTQFAMDSIAECQRCHTSDLIQRKTNPNVRYDHAVVVSTKMDCKSCHSNVVQGTGDVPRQACMSCHFETEKLAKYDDVRFVHENHVTNHKIECQNCHILIQHKLQKVNPSTPPDCNSCHPGTHMEQKILFSGHGGNTRLDAPSKMYQSGLDCKGCHVLHGMVKDGIKVTRAGGKACESCHGPGFDKILDTWKEYSATKLTEIEGIYRHAAGTIHNARPADPSLHAVAENLLTQADDNIRIVRIGKGVHNIQYASQLLSSAYDLLHTAMDTLGRKSGLPKFSLNATSVTPSECRSCHQRMEDYKPVPVFGMEFKHSAHLNEAKLACDNCHSSQPKHGTLVMNKASCSSCHHKEAPVDDNCKKCHTTQFMVYEGKVAGMGADPMKEADVKCVDCHATTELKITRDVGNKCASCHDSKYPGYLPTYRSEIASLTGELKKLLNGSGNNEAAHSLLSIIEKDGSNGAHNHVGITEKLEKMIKELKDKKTSALKTKEKNKG